MHMYMMTFNCIVLVNSSYIVYFVVLIDLY